MQSSLKPQNPYENQYKDILNNRRNDFIKQKIPDIKIQLSKMEALINRVLPIIDGLHSVTDIQTEFASKFQNAIKSLENICKEFIQLFDELYQIMHNTISTIHRPNTAVLTHLFTQLLEKKLIPQKNEEDLVKEYTAIFNLLNMLFKKLYELHQVCIGHIRQLEMVVEEEKISEEKGKEKSIDNDATEEENVTEESITDTLNDETWLNIIKFSNEKDIDSLGATNSRFLNITRDRERYTLFPIATDFSQCISEKHCAFNEEIYSALSENGKWLAVSEQETIEGKKSNYIGIYTPDGEKIHTIPLISACQYLSFTHDSSKLIIYHLAKICEIYTTANWEKNNEFTISRLSTNIMCVNNTSLFALHLVRYQPYSYNTYLYSYDLSNGNNKFLCDLGQKGRLLSQNKILASIDQTKVIGIIGDGRTDSLYVVDITNGTTNTIMPQKFSLGRDMPPLNLQLLPHSNKVLFSTPSTMAISEYSLKTNVAKGILKTSCSVIKHFKISRNGRYLVAAIPPPFNPEKKYREIYHAIELYNLRSGKLLQKIICPLEIDITDLHITAKKVVVIQGKYLSIYTFKGMALQPDFNKLREENEKIDREDISNVPITTIQHTKAKHMEIETEETEEEQHESTLRTCIMC